MNTENAIVPVASQLPAAPEAAPQVTVFMPPHVAEVVPFRDYEEYDKLSIPQRARLSLLLETFQEIAEAPEGVMLAAKRLALPLNLSHGRLLNLRTAFKRHGWRALAKIYKGPQELPEEFCDYVRGLVLKNKRCTRTQLQELRDAWAEGKSIKGYGTWREWFAIEYPDRDMPAHFPGVFPKGWSETNLYSLQPTRPQRKAARQGYASMKRYIPSVVRNTESLMPLELITVDDFELDFLIRAFNPVRRRWEICRCAGLLAIDVATRRKLAIALIPRFRLTKKERAQAEASVAANAEIEDETAQDQAANRATRISITRRDVQSLIHHVFATFGRPANYGCTVLVENAAAAISYDLEMQLHSLLQVQVSRTGLIHEKTLRNGFVQGGGRPWEKGWIESLFNLVWNRAGALPGQKGSSYEKKPADHEAAVAYAMKLLDRVPSSEVERFRLPFLTIDQALDGLNAIFERIERRTDHKMIGFEQKFRYRLPDGSAEVDERSLALMPAEQLTRCEPIPYNESPAERWEKLMASKPLAPVPAHVLALMLMQPKECEVIDHKITFSLPGRGGFTFADSESPLMRLPNGTKLLGYLDPTAPHVLYCTDEKGAYLGRARRRGAPIDIRDHSAISAEAGEIAKLVRACVTGPVREYLADENQALAEMDAHNLRLQQELGVEKPVTITPLPDAKPSQAQGTDAPNPATLVVANPASAAKRPASLSQRLAHASRPEPVERAARDAFTAHREALARGIAADVTAQEASKAHAATLQQAGDDLDPSQLL
jgi:hypothetical protein